MPTTFISVQCFQCSTMQVKQQKKSTNKWSCVVCNEKQSVRKVFAQSAMATDVRKFVQNFNMSRQSSDQKQSLPEEIVTFNSQSDSRKTKRNDWSEYVDDPDEYGGKFDIPEGDYGLEPMVVTEIPKALFKKPKAKDYSSNGHGSGKMFKPIFPERHARRHRNEISHDITLTEFEKISSEKASDSTDDSNEEHMSLHPSNRGRWNCFKEQIQDGNSNSDNSQKPFVRQPRKAVPGLLISSWSDHITQEDENSNAFGARTVQSHHTPAVSKRNRFITEEGDIDSLEIGRGRYSLGRVSQHPLEKLMKRRISNLISSELKVFNCE